MKRKWIVSLLCIVLLLAGTASAIWGAEAIKSRDLKTAAGAIQTADAKKLDESKKTQEVIKTAEAIKTDVAIKTAEAIKSAEAINTAEAIKSAEAIKTAEALPQKKSFTLKEAVALALKDNDQVALARLGVDKAALALEQAEFNKKKLINILPNINRKDQNSAMVIDVVPAQAQAGVTIAQAALAYTEKSISYSVEAAYFGLLQGERNLQVKKASLNRAGEQLKLAQAKLKAGTAAKIEVISAEAQVKSAQAEVNGAKAQVEKARMSFNKTLGLDLDTAITLTDPLVQQKIEEIDVEKVFEEMKTRDLSYVTAQAGLQAGEAVWAYHEKYYTPNTFVYRDAQYKYKEGQVNLARAEADLQLNIQSAYLDLKTAQENIEVLTKTLEQVKEAYRLTKLRYDVGMATGYDLINSDTTIQEVELGLLNALYNCNMMKAKFSYGIFPGAALSSASGM